MKAISALLVLSAAAWATNPAPTITSISPVSGPPAGGTVVKIVGTNFTIGATVTFGSTSSATVTFVSKTELKATSPASPGSAEGPVNLTVTNPDTQFATLANGFDYFLPAPTITSILPVYSNANGGTVITINGTNFVLGAVAAFGPNNATTTTFVSKTQLKATTPPSTLNNSGSNEGSVSVFVTNPDGQFAKLPQGLTYHDPPSITSISPAGGSMAGGYTVTLNGQNFRAGATVMFGTVASPSVVYNGGTNLTVTVPAQTAAGPVNVVIKDTDGLGYTLKNGFTYGAVSITSVSPTVGPLGGANKVTIQGAGFTSATTVTFGTIAATSVTFVSPSQLIAVAPAHVAAIVAITVSNTNGSDTMTAAYTFTGHPIVTTVVPASGPLTGGTTVTISGANLKNVVSVLFGSSPATVISAAGGALKVTSPAFGGGANPVSIQVTTNNGSVTVPSAFFYDLSILTQGLDDGYAGIPYSNTLSVTGGTPPYKWSITSGSLPSGLTLNSSTGVISGTPAANYNSYTLGFQVTDSATPANSASTNLTFNILFGFSTEVIPPNFFGMILYDQTIWPTVTFGALGKGLATTWPFIEPNPPAANQPPVYNWQVLDQYVIDAQAHQTPGTNQPLTLYWTNANIPQWAAEDTTTCSTYTGTTITACTSAIAPAHIQDFTNFMTALVTRYLGKIQIYELWSEPNVSNVYTGSFADLANMTSIAYNVIRQNNPTATILSPSPTQAPYLYSYLTTPGAPLGFDGIAIHGYPDVLVNDTAEAIVGFKSVNIKLTMAQVPGIDQKPIWDTESSWGGLNSITEPNLRAGFVARSFLLHWSVGIHNMYWYGWDAPVWGTLYYAPPGVGVTPAAAAYQQTYNWMVGASMPAPCTANGGSTYSAVYTCQLTRPGGYQGLAVWDTTQTCTNGVCTTSTYIPSAMYTQYRDLTGQVTTIAPGQPIQIGVKPILLENFSPAGDPPPPSNATFTYSGLTPPLISESVNHPNVPGVPNSGNQAHTFAPASGQIAPQNLLVVQGLSAPSVVNTNALDSDATLAVGTSQVMQWADFGLEVYNKSGAPLGGVQGAAFWSDNSPCSGGVGADGQVQFDKIASVWLVGMRSGPNTECIAVSQSSDATLQYNEYSLQYVDPLHPDYQMDYPKLTVWPDGYYIVFDMLDTSVIGYPPRYSVVCALERSSMLLGSSGAQAICFTTLYNNNTGFFHLLPTDLDSAMLPPAGSPNHIFTFAKPVGATQYHLYRYEFHVNWSTPSASTMTGPFQIDTNAFDTYLPACGAGNNNCVPQPSPAWTPLDSVGGYLMGRAAYRNFGTYESLVFSQAAQTSTTSPVGVRWYELRNLSTTPTIYQSGFLQAANSSVTPDSFSRWMSAVAQDSAGNIAMGYSISGAAATSYYSGLPGLAIDARAPNTPLGTLLTEDIVFAGVGVELPVNAPNNPKVERWGSVAGMAIDPVNQCTFWFTGQYEPSNGIYNWSTKLVSFSLPGCQ